jgi:hypothetical protein
MNEITIKIWPASDEGYMYDIFDTSEPTEDAIAVDGGQCTTTLENALEMAYEQAQALISKAK